MKKAALLMMIFVFAAFMAAAGDINWKRVEASQLTICGKAFDTPNPYHRIDTAVYKGFTEKEKHQCCVPAGLTVLFKTDADKIGTSVKFVGGAATAAYRSYRGFDLYIKKDGKWLWAGSNSFTSKNKDPEEVQLLVGNMAPGQKECLLYLPIYAEIENCQVCVPEGSGIAPLDSPFRHKIVFHGSSFTHGVSCTRGGMSYPMIFMRRTGLQVIPLGFSGRCKMQPYFLEALMDIDADAYVFDPFSNLPAKEIIKRFMPFFEGMVKAHPGKPIIIQRTIYWERSNFNTEALKTNMDRWAASDSLCNILCKKCKDVYYIKPDAALHNGESSSADGTHPNDNGYALWEASIEASILKILGKYGIK